MAIVRWPGLLLICFSLLSSAAAQQSPLHRGTQARQFGANVGRERARPARNSAAASAPRYAPDRLLVRFRTTATRQLRSELHAAAGARDSRAARIVPGLEIVRLRAGVRVADALRQYRRNAQVQYAEPDYLVHHFGQPNDPSFASLWGLHNLGDNGGKVDADIDAPEAWNVTTGSTNVVVGIIDSGIDYNHPDLAANLFTNSADCDNDGVDDDQNGYVDDCHGIDAYWGDSDAYDDLGHGTHVAGIIGAVGNNAVGVVGVNWQVKIAACKFLGPDGSGPTSAAIECLQYFKELREHGVNLVATNNSWGGGAMSQALYDAIDAHRQAGILFVAAAGNSASDNDTWANYPSNYTLPNIVAVAATTSSDTLADFSSFGARTVHLGAPGAEILSTVPGEGYALKSGTSMATPYVTGVAALLKANNPALDWRAIKNLILAGGDTIASLSNTITGKRLNALGALTCGNSEVLRRLQPVGSVATAVAGIPIELQVLHINCSSPAGEVVVTVDPGGTTISLKDDGVAPDQQAGDGVYTAEWQPAQDGAYTLNFANVDSLPLQVLKTYKYSAAPFEYRNIGGTSLNLTANEDEFRWLDAPFPIKFGGGAFDRLGVNLNGTISLTDAFSDWWWTPLPNPGPATLVAPSWTALWAFPGTQQNVFWDVVGTTPNRELVIEWRNVESLCVAPANITFQTVFFENSSDIIFNYKDMIFGSDQFGNNCGVLDDGGRASAGVQVARRVATQYSYEEQLLKSSTAVRWTLGAPLPVITDMWPFSAARGEPGIVLELWGESFLPTSAVQWNGAARPTTFIDSTYIQAQIPTSDLTNSGSTAVTVATPDGGTSAARALMVYSSYPVPVIASLPRTEFTLGDPAITMAITGSNFTAKSVLRINGVERKTYPLSATQLYADLPASDFAHAGTMALTVFNPAPGGGSSSAITLTVKNLVPSISLLTPNFKRVGSAAFELQVAGSGLSDTSVVRWNGADRPTTAATYNAFASISASDVAQPGTADVTIYNPPPGGGLSNAIKFEVLLPPVNDEITGAISFASLPFTDSRDIRAASPHPSDPQSACATQSNLNSVWYRYQASESQKVTFDAIGGVFSPLMSIWSGQPNALTEITCSAGFGMPETTINAVAGNVYWVMIGSADGAAYIGPFSFVAAANAPLPVLDSVTPSATGGGSDSQLHLTGSGFSSTSVVLWDGFSLPTTFVSSTELRAVMSGNTWLGPHQVSVLTPSPGGGSSSSKTVTVTGFDFKSSPTTVSVNAGQGATFALTVTPEALGFEKVVNFACAGLASGLSCSFSPQSGTPGTTPLLSTLTISTTTSAARQHGATYEWMALLPFAVGIVLVRRRARLATLMCLVMTTTICLLSCGGGGGSATTTTGSGAVTYTIQVTASSGTLQKSALLTLNVQR